MRTPMRIVFSLLALVSALLTVGCGTLQSYSGERLSKEETALITIGFGGSAEIVAVDGQEPGFGNYKVEVLPGAHAVSARVVEGYQGG